MKLLWCVMLLLVMVLQFRLWVGENSFSQAHSLTQQVEGQRSQNQLLLDRNEQLEQEVLDLKSGVEAIEERARTELGMIGPNETFFLVVSRPKLP